MLAAEAEFRLPRHLVDLFAHLVEGGNTRCPLGLGVLAMTCSISDARLVSGGAARQPLDQGQPDEALRPVCSAVRPPDPSSSTRAALSMSSERTNGNGLQRFDLEIVIAADRRAARTARPLPARAMIGTPAKEWNFSSPSFGPIGKVRVRRRFSQSAYRRCGDRADQALTDRHAGLVHGALSSPRVANSSSMPWRSR